MISHAPGQGPRLIIAYEQDLELTHREGISAESEQGILVVF